MAFWIEARRPAGYLFKDRLITRKPNIQYSRDTNTQRTEGVLSRREKINPIPMTACLFVSCFTKDPNREEIRVRNVWRDRSMRGIKSPSRRRVIWYRQQMVVSLSYLFKIQKLTLSLAHTSRRYRHWTLFLSSTLLSSRNGRANGVSLWTQCWQATFANRFLLLWWQSHWRITLQHYVIFLFDTSMQQRDIWSRLPQRSLDNYVY